jgi:hypothetical protein
MPSATAPASRPRALGAVPLAAVLWCVAVGGAVEVAAADAPATPSVRWSYEPGVLAGAFAMAPPAAGGSEGRAADPLEAAATAPSPAPPIFGGADTWRFNAVAGAISNLGSTNGGQFRLEFEYFLIDRFSLVMEIELSGFNQPDSGAAVVSGGGVLLRWHFLEGPGWTVYADAGCGLAYASSDIPPGTNRIKFSPQIGVGFTLAIAEPIRLIGGVRWYHLSNARIAQTNDGFDGVMIYLGLSVPF